MKDYKKKFKQMKEKMEDFVDVKKDKIEDYIEENKEPMKKMAKELTEKAKGNKKKIGVAVLGLIPLYLLARKRK